MRANWRRPAGRSTVIDRRPHIAGNAFDEVDSTGIRRHVYGPHLFHTKSERVMAWLRRFADFMPYQHRVSAYRAGNRALRAAAHQPHDGQRGVRRDAGDAG